MPILRLLWPAKMYQLVITDRDRLLMGTYGALGGLSDKKRYDKSAVSLANAVEEKQGLAIKLTAARVGLPAPRFARAFERRFGVSPRLYRQRHSPSVNQEPAPRRGARPARLRH